MRDDLLPDACSTAKLGRLHSRVEPAPRDVMELELEHELGRPVDEVFDDFESWEPIGSASVAQAYLARLPTGESVIVKVQRPDMEAIVARDSASLRRSASVLERRTPLGQELHVTELADEFVRTSAGRARLQPGGGERHRPRRSGPARVRPYGSPRVHRDLTSRRVLVEERFDGISVDERDQWRTLGLDGTELADRLVQTMKHKLSTATSTPTPIPERPPPRDAAWPDRLRPDRRHRSPQRTVMLLQMTSAAGVMAWASATRSSRWPRSGARGPTPHSSRRGPLLCDERRPRAQLAGGAERPDPPAGPFDIRLPAELTTFFRALVLLEGTARTIDPGYQLMDGVRRALGDGDGPPVSYGRACDQLEQAVLRELPRLQRLPGHVERIAALTARGDLRVQVGLFGTGAGGATPHRRS